MPAPYGDGLYAVEPLPGNGLNITDLFHIVDKKLDDPDINSVVDSKYPNVAIITFDKQNRFGGMWAKEKLDLTRPFATEMYLYLGRQYGPNTSIADGMTFTMHNDPAGINAIGGAGEGLGVYRGRKFSGSYTPQGDPITVQHGEPLKNALTVEFDTYRNRIADQALVDDPAGAAHCSLLIPKAAPITIQDHLYTQTFTPVQNWVKFTARWTPDGFTGGLLEYNFDGQQHSHQILNVQTTFGASMVYWGFTGATGKLTSVQAVAITRLPEQGVKIEKTVKNAAGADINHGSALPGEILTYTVRVTALPLTNPIGPIFIEDNISSLTEFVSADVMVTTNTGGMFTVQSTYGDNFLNVNTLQYLNNENDWIEVRYNVKVNEDAAGTIYNSAIANAKDLSERKESNITDVSIFAAPEKRISDLSEAGKNGAIVNVGDRITYEIQYANEGDTPITIEIIDELDSGLTFAQASNGGKYVGADHAVTWTLNNVSPNTISVVRLTVVVNEIAVLKVVNNATITVNGTPHVVGPVENPVAPKQPVKKVASVSVSGKDGAAVKAGDVITYEISYLNYTESDAQIVITDRLPIGVEYHDSDPPGTYVAGTRTVTWTLPTVQSKVSGVVKVQVTVNTTAAFQIVNYATVKVGTAEPQNTNFVVNPIVGGGCPGMKLTTKCRVTISGKKIWQDNNNDEGKRPPTVDITLFRDGEVYKTTTVSSDGNWTYTFFCLPIWKTPRSKYVYRVDEIEVPTDYMKTIDGYNIINTLN